MTRWRPPAPGSTALITGPGMDRLREELDRLWLRERPEVVAALAAAAAEGDRSENAEYTYRKRQLAGIDRRIRYLGNRLAQLRVVDASPTDRSAVYFGAWFTIRGEDAVEHGYRIVGPDETDARLGWISIDSPLARAVLKRHAGDSVEAELPDRHGRFEILAVRYEEP